ncbi:MAG: lipid A biosynthesis acyltransferase [Burkholderiaceae bacterium]
MIRGLASKALIALLRLMHRWPFALQVAVGRGIGRVAWWLAAPRRRIALRNLELCLPELPAAERRDIAREHFALLGRSLVERGLLWFASPEQLKAMIHVEGDVQLAERSERPVMWLVPHFVALDIAGAATQLFQTRMAASIYQAQSNPVFNHAIRAGRLRFGRAELFSRGDGAKPLMRAVKQGHAFFNLPDMDFGLKDAAFVPFFGIPAATLLAPSRLARALDMVVQPVVGEVLPGSQGYRVRFLEPWSDFPTADAEADTARLNRWIESEVRRMPAQYLWVHKRFKTRPPGERAFY